MALSSLFGSKQQETILLNILLTPQTVQSRLVKVVGGLLEVISQSKKHDYSDLEDCLVRTDESLQELGPQSENVNEVVFGLESSWVNQTGVTDDKKPILKRLTQELSLEAVGFVVTPEALIQEQLQEDPHLSEVLLYVTRTTLELLVVFQGTLQRNELVGRSNSILDDFNEAIARINPPGVEEVRHFPSKIVLASLELDQEELQELQQQVLVLDWEAQEAFVSQPTVKLLSPTSSAQVVALQGATAVANARGLLSPQQAVDAVQAAVAKEAPEIDSAPEVPLIGSPPIESATSFGVPIDAAKLPESPKITALEQAEEAVATPRKSSLLDRFRTEPRTRHFVIGGVVAGLITLLLLAVGVVVFQTSAQVELVLKQQPVSKEVTLTVEADRDASDPQNLILAAQTVSAEVSGEETIDATGVKIVGEKAVGKVLIYNKTTSQKTFVAGTTISSGGRTFSLDADITVPAAQVQQSSDGEQKNYGKTSATVTATEIGAEGNLAKESEFTVADFSPNTYTAKSEEAFSGGASREVRVVSEADRQTVLAELKKQLLKQAGQKLTDKASPGEYILPASDIALVKTDYSAEVDTEADQLTLTASGTVTTLVYTAEALKPIAQAVLASEVPNKYQLLMTDPQIMSAPGETASDSAATTLEVNISSIAIPVIEPKLWKLELAGKSVKEAESLLKSKSEISRATVSLRPALAERLGIRLPKSDKIVLITDPPINVQE